MISGSTFEMNKKEEEKNSNYGSFSPEESIFILFFILNSDWNLTENKGLSK